jgi:tRNA G18 (ribose-2'-O)-methylase SpoU
MLGKVGSLNASAAAAALLYETSRQRLGKGRPADL